MPKKKEAPAESPPPTPTRFPRRAASKEALKQMQKITAAAEDDSPETLEIPSDDEEVVSVDPTPKKKYRLSHRKSADDRDVIVLKTINYENDSLVLDSWTEELSPAQVAMRQATFKEIDEISQQLEKILKETPCEVIYTGTNSALYEIEQEIRQPPPVASVAPSTSKKVTPAANAQPAKGTPPIQLVMDPRSGVVVGTMTPATSATIAAVTNAVVKPMTRKRTRTAANLTTSPQLVKVAKTGTTPVQPTATEPASQPAATASASGTEATAPASVASGSAAQKAGAPVVDLTSDEMAPPDSREVSFNKLQGKTFPSLVVVARPFLRVKELNPNFERVKLDSKVKAVLMHPPTKFTEWLIQTGLIRSSHVCSKHQNTKLKLGMYSDVTKFTFSGGYVWISQCCPNRFVSVFSGSLFEGCPHPPTVILKLIYHWACQTNVQNVVQWVKVDNLYVKGINTWLRATCTAAVHTHLNRIGGAGRSVEVGVISLGTTSQDGNQRQVKVEVLGVMDCQSKMLRLRAVEPMIDGDRNYRKRFSKILEPLVAWVDPESAIVTDLTVDRNTLLLLGFKNVTQVSTKEGLSNKTIMDYLRRIVPRMFQNTLSLLSRPIIQQFLDELVWREWFGTTPPLAFDNIILHIAEQTKIDNVHLINRLTNIASNPFKDCSLQKQALLPPPAPPVQPLTVNTTNATKTYKARKSRAPSPVPETSLKPRRSTSPDVPEQIVPLEHYYYGTIETVRPKPDRINNVTYKCGMCKARFTNNLLLMNHLFSHVELGKFYCRYCLVSLATYEMVEKHIQMEHPTETKHGESYVCMICASHFSNTYSLGLHMSREHVPSELPYECKGCGFRCSSHRQLVDHFYSYHDGGPAIQCPLCLKYTYVTANGKSLTQNFNYYVQHLQKHLRRYVAKKCPKCCLTFIQKEQFREHSLKMHHSMKRKAGLLPWPVPRTNIMVPKSRLDEPIEEEEVDITNLSMGAVSDKLICKECGIKMKTKEHFPSVQNCSNQNCRYTTCCLTAMFQHLTVCKDLHSSIQSSPMPSRMYCVCGYHDTDGNYMAKHLTVCERKSAYPSEAEAKAATVTHSMLDVLGLMRKTDEPSTSNLLLAELKEDWADNPKEDSNNAEKSEEDVPMEEDKEDKEVESDNNEKEVVEGDATMTETVPTSKNNGESVHLTNNVDENDVKEEEEGKENKEIPEENGLPETISSTKEQEEKSEAMDVDDKDEVKKDGIEINVENVNEKNVIEAES